MARAQAAGRLVRRWPSTNCWFGRPFGPPIAFVLHTQAGGESGTVAEFLSSASQFSVHYSVGLDGSIDCFVDPGDRAWANGILEPGNHWEAIAEECGVDPQLNPNQLTVSCETEDLGDTRKPVSDSQFSGVLYAAWEAKQRYPESLRYLLRHSDISPESRASCPGDRWVSSGLFRSLADELELKTVSP
jgi:N-acetyl-anhydromuramyl-L-alanine amidase AmpD